MHRSAVQQMWQRSDKAACLMIREGKNRCNVESVELATEAVDDN